ncbi:Hsp20/alpha crystallin family protein [Chlorobium phaeovibrioides]|uniref:Hsp20 family protein n=2 Tax=Chlorobium phaeovibrioides TaxID=1094 RepID=A0A432AUC3_CHLPH|nr:Hsp20/alpha crystallin family protein [Chlorobium phaeovibrioides]HCD36639.1 Hsp20/alpha crystallin family protein [Chlorobium sp.]KAA6231957.1 Hsp20/alpha crystallin family protein [Chlorobium phaeovibrioides]MWV53583.1 Hsp20 family protein [Chlorobium phaeovibrioides]QEQ57488.1 Hsp20/alpha crystallin family protein [Chlorobium phaeovibrioides]RTY37868.1 Hsp20/alpha crystallin family protein [Chlorobium phaeovibrioides]
MTLKLYGRDPMKMFEDVFTDKVSPFFTSMMSPAFKVDISEDDKAIFIEADMPGMKKEDVTVSMEDDVLSISAEREHSEEEKKKGYHRIERSWGSLSRSFTVGDNVDSEHIDASYDNGVLKIVVPKKEPEPKRGVEIPVK